MRRRRLRWLLGALVLVSLAMVVWQLQSSLEEQKESDVGDSPLEGMLPHAVQWIQDFRRIEIKDGRKAWEVEADEAQYLEGQSQVVVRGPRASFFLDGGEQVSVRSDHGQLFFAGRDLRRVVLRGNVEIKVRDFVIHVNRARYDRPHDRIVAKGRVEIVGEELQVRGRDMVVFMKDARFELREQVQVTLLPGTGKPTS